MRTVQALERLVFGPLSAPQLAAALQMDQRTARRLLRRLEAEGYVTAEAGCRRRYQLTHRLAAVGRQAIAHDPLPHLAVPHLALLATSTGRPASLWIPCYTDVVCLLAAEPDDNAPPIPVLGALVPAHASAPGKALLAHRPRWRESLLTARLPRHTARTLVDPHDLRAELKRIQTRGHAADNGEHHDDVLAIAAPVFLDGEAIAALAIRLDDAAHAIGEPDALIQQTTSIATALTHALSHH
jgi:DNA-binding IclR family transcriptional regulator